MKTNIEITFRITEGLLDSIERFNLNPDFNPGVEITWFLTDVHILLIVENNQKEVYEKKFELPLIGFCSRLSNIKKELNKNKVAYATFETVSFVFSYFSDNEICMEICESGEVNTVKYRIKKENFDKAVIDFNSKAEEFLLSKSFQLKKYDNWSEIFN